MTWRALVESDFARGGIAVHLGQRGVDGYTTVVEPMQIDLTVRTAAEGATHRSEPALRIPDDLGRALLAALAEHYGGTSPALTDRADLIHERGRVDKLINHLISGGAA
ncbi:hypothetical protein [Catenuloplanes indicus]|uniref:Uncharacterized protein n=1 Tax=Catenuloplanes indicus TaxID=137267 RepID=A0AAE3WAU4_9ACTN|nr:hypothetical protein [Catenuloplanes indicus]MDQ0371590.1 hypothetical protein [Catenuloplanes indicus]